MVMVITAISENKRSLLEELGVKDSKKLTPKKREQINLHLKEFIDYELISISPEEIDDAIRSENLNLNWLEAIKSAELFVKLNKRNKIDKLYLDCPSPNKKAYTEYIKNYLTINLKSAIPQIIAEFKADDIYPIVSAASILAKVERDAQIKQLKVKYGDFGSGYPSDVKTRNFLKNWIVKNHNLPPFTRTTWNTIKNIQNELAQKKIDSF